jgi:hypothetical protein
LDTEYVAALSDDAVPETISLLNVMNDERKKALARGLHRHLQYENEAPGRLRWQAFNFSSVRARKILRVHIDQLNLLSP